MKIKQILDTKKVTLSFEIFPPKKQDNLSSVIETAEKLSSLKPDFMSITYGAGGSTQGNTTDLAVKINSSGTNALAHLTCIGSSQDKIRREIKSMKERGIENILALRGDIPQGLTKEEAVIPGLEHASDLVKILKQENFCVGGACYPEGHPESANREDDIENTKFKVDAGVDFLTTQMFFDNNMLYSYMYRLQSKGIHVPVIAGIMPITNASQVNKMIRLSNAFVPQKLLSICDKFYNDEEAMKQAGIAYATDQIIDLISNGIKGIHIYTMNKPWVAESILKNIDSIVEAVNK
jgi:methylenetetrahydrofolate reductase (NADPH)